VKRFLFFLFSFIFLFILLSQKDIFAETYLNEGDSCSKSSLLCDPSQNLYCEYSPLSSVHNPLGKCKKIDQNYDSDKDMQKDKNAGEFIAPCAEGALNADGICEKVSTGLGIDINVSPEGFVKSFFGILLSISGGIALLLIIISGYKLIASRGNPERVTEAKDRFTSAIIGLLFIVFSLVILQIIGVDILHMPGLSP
jgi:hypothetical protein